MLDDSQNLPITLHAQVKEEKLYEHLTRYKRCRKKKKLKKTLVIGKMLGHIPIKETMSSLSKSFKWMKYCE